jgi:hypothetical protein
MGGHLILPEPPSRRLDNGSQDVAPGMDTCQKLADAVLNPCTILAIQGDLPCSYRSAFIESATPEAFKAVDF